MAADEAHIETEIKLRVPDAEGGRTLIEGHGYTVAMPRVFESNALYDTEDHALQQRGELIRVRRAGQLGILTFKAAHLPGRHKRRTELETQVADPAMVESILERLGLTLTFRYEKYRTEFRRASADGVITLDETPIGVFLELEGTAEWIDDAARELGFEESDYILSSYGRLYIDHCHAKGVTPTSMVFK
jgi:adenylate cyclase class 2